MPQAPGSLSAQQRATLESVYWLLRTTRPLLDSLCSKLQLSDRLQLQGIVRLLLLNESRLAEHFPEVSAIEERNKQRGGVR